MTLVILVAISMMWIPVGLFFLGSGDAKTCGMMTFSVGIITIIGGILNAIAPTPNLWDATILIPFGLLYLVIGHALLWGVENMKSVGNASLMLSILCGIYCIANMNGYPAGLAKVAPVPYLAFMFATFAVLTALVWGNCYGKISAKLVGGLLIVLTFTGLIAPVFSLFLFGAFPF
jgi:apolipoprotein N-acyltransferase